MGGFPLYTIRAVDKLSGVRFKASIKSLLFLCWNGYDIPSTSATETLKSFTRSISKPSISDKTLNVISTYPDIIFNSGSTFKRIS